MPLYEMVIELLAGIGAWFVFVFLGLSYHMYAHYPSYRNFKHAHNSPVTACLLTQGTWLLMALASVTTE